MHKNNSYQFLHIETFALKPRKNTKRPSAEAVARECQRADQSYPHIATPKQPELLYGITPMEALERVKNLVKECKDPLGRKIRSDAQIISFGVASIKVESTDENWNSPQVKKWLKDTENYLKKRFGSHFVSLVKHSDERFCHIHFCIMPTKDENGILDINSLHPGLAAQRSVKSKSRSVKDQAYKQSMRELQDDYFKDVGLVNGQLRYGPRRRRLTRSEWHAQKSYADLLSKIFSEQSSLVQKLSSKLDKAKNMLTNLLTSKFHKSANLPTREEEVSYESK